MNKKKLSLKESWLVGLTLFGLFFGAGNLIFPVHLGQLAGANTWPAAIGFIITAVGIPVLGVAAIGMTHSDNLQVLAGKVAKWYGIAFTVALYLTIGPFFAIPRCATTSFTVGTSALIGDGNVALIQFFFVLVFFGLVLFFSLRPSDIMTWVGKIITPAFLVFFAILLLAAFLNPSATVASVPPVPEYETGAFFNGFVEGYGTMDAIAGLAFGVIVTGMIRKLGVNDDESVGKSTLTSGIFTVILMVIIYLLSIVMGTQSRGILEVSENGGIALAQLSQHYLGSFGLIILAITITLACLKTAIGLVTSCAEMFVTMFPKSFSYKMWAVIFTVFSFGIANVGLTALISYSLPVLMLLYPLAIVLIALGLCDRLFGGSRFVYAGVTAGAFVAAVFDFLKTLPAELQEALHAAPAIDFAGKIFPLFDQGLGWLLPAMIGLAVGILLKCIFQKKK